ncbi:MAG: hypothetical protein WCF84_06835 [Anaerolineae bacterium]
MKHSLTCLLSTCFIVLFISACTAPAAAPTPAPAIPVATGTATVAVPNIPTATVPPTVAPVVPTTAILPTAVPAAPTITSASTSARDCRQITMLGPNPPNSPNALDAENCFRQSFESCASATLTVSIRGVDAGTTHVFTIVKSAGGCRVSDTLQSYVIPLRTPSPSTVQCTGVVTRNGGLVITGCGDEGDILIPAP